jgi:hypothetical protein
MTHGAIDMITISDGVFEGLEDDACNAFTSCKAICRSIERLAFPVFGEYAGFGILDPFIDPRKEDTVSDMWSMRRLDRT